MTTKMMMNKKHTLVTTYLPILPALMYTMFVYLTYISPETLWETHNREFPMDPVWSYSVKAKGSAIFGLLVNNLLATFVQPLKHRWVSYTSCMVFQLLALLHHGRCYFLEKPGNGYFVDSTMHFQYVMIHSLGCMIFSFLIYESKKASPAVKQNYKSKGL